MSAAKSGRVSAGPKRASDVTMPPAENPIMPTRSGRYPNSPACSRTSRTACRPSSAANLITSSPAGPRAPGPVWMSRYFRTKASTPIALSRRAMSTPS